MALKTVKLGQKLCPKITWEGEWLGKLGLTDWAVVELEVELRSVRISDRGLVLYVAIVTAPAAGTEDDKVDHGLVDPEKLEESSGACQ